MVGGHRHAPAVLLAVKNLRTCYRGGCEWAPGSVWTITKKRKSLAHTVVRTLNHPARSESLYRALPASLKTKIDLSYKLVKDSAAQSCHIAFKYSVVRNLYKHFLTVCPNRKPWYLTNLSCHDILIIF